MRVHVNSTHMVYQFGCGCSARCICRKVCAANVVDMKANTMLKALAYVHKMYVACPHDVPRGHASDVFDTSLK